MSEPPARLLRLFRYDHLPPKLQAISKPFGLVAEWMATSLPDTDQTRLGMQRLVEAKDCAVRGALDHPTPVREFTLPLLATRGSDEPQDG